MSQLEWTEELVPPPPGYYGTSRGYALKGSKITATLTEVCSGVWVLYCGPLDVNKVFSYKLRRTLDQLLQDAKACLLTTAEKKLCDLQAFVDQVSDSESPQ